jgi:hypothetical protein
MDSFYKMTLSNVEFKKGRHHKALCILELKVIYNKSIK